MKMASFWLTVRVCSSLRPCEGKSCVMESSLFEVYLLLPLSRKRISSRSSLKSSLRVLKTIQLATRGWPGSPTERTWTEPRWPCWSTKATRFHLFILWRRRMNWISSTSSSKATERRGRGQECWPLKPKHSNVFDFSCCRKSLNTSLHVIWKQELICKIIYLIVW